MTLIRLTAAQVAALTDGALHGSDTAPANGYSDDTRALAPGQAFLAFGGGAAFAEAAAAAGAVFMVATVPHHSLPTVVVESVERAALDLAAEAVASSGVKVIAITGSTGKTLTKDMTVAALRAEGLRVHGPRGSRNNEIGAPMTVLECPAGTEVVVVEIGARGIGQVAELAEPLRPTVSIITTIGRTHLGEFGSVRIIADTKSELAASTLPDGLVLAQSTDRWLAVISEAARAAVRTVGFGGHVLPRCERLDAEGRPVGTLTIDGRTVPLAAPLPGRALLTNAAFAVAAATQLGVDPQAAASAVASAPTSGLRMVRSTVGTWDFFDDSYNANPTSVAMALRTVAELAGDRPRYAVLGVMAELGDDESADHQRIAALARRLGFEVIGVGEGSEMYGCSPVDVSEVASLIQPNSVVLAKGSRVARLDRLQELLTQ